MGLTGGAPQGVWTPTPVIEWLILEAWRIVAIPDLLGSLARHLLDAGVPLWRFFCLVPTLHPLYADSAYRWVRDDPVIFHGFGEHGLKLRPAYAANPLKLIVDDGYSGVRRRLDGSYRDGEFPLLDELKAAGATDYVAMPLEFTGGGRTAVSFATDHRAGFSGGHLAEFYNLLPVLARLIERETLRSTAENLLNTYVGRSAGGRILKGQIRRGSGETINAAIWYCDLRGFTALTAKLPQDRLIGVLNDYLDAMADPVQRHCGEVLKFMGDGLLAIFPVSPDGDATQACALEAAIEARAGMAALNDRRSAEGEPPLDYGLTLHLGAVTYGNIGAADRLDFTVIGNAVNEAQRMEELCKILNRCPLMSAGFAALSPMATLCLGDFPLRGMASSLAVHCLAGDAQ